MAETVWRSAYDFHDELMSEIDANNSDYVYYSALGRISTDLVEYRIQHGLSQIDLADVLGVSQAMVSKYESGDYNISLKSVVQLYSKLNLSLGHIFGTAEEKADDPIGDPGGRVFSPLRTGEPVPVYGPACDIA